MHMHQSYNLISGCHLKGVSVRTVSLKVLTNLFLKKSCVKEPHSTRFSLEVLANLQALLCVSKGIILVAY